MFRNQLIIIIIIFAASAYSASDTLLTLNGYPVDSIYIVGNKITEDDIIFRELTFRIGDEVNPELLNYNKERIYSLGIFNKVDLYLKKAYGKNILVIDVEESWYIYPIPFITIKDRDWDKISYGIDFIVKNFRGRNELLRLRGSLGYDPSIFIDYYNPVLIPKEDIFFGTTLSYVNRKNKSETAENILGHEFSQKIFGAQVGFGKRFGLYNRINLNLGFDYVESPVFVKGLSASNSRIDRVPKIGLSYSLDTRDLIQFPKKGLFAFAGIEFKGLSLNEISYRVINFDFREYFGILENFFAKWRITTRLTSGKLVPYYDYSFLGFEERIRGHYSDVMEGNNFYLGSVELYSTLLKDTHVSLDFLPILPKELLSYRLAIYAQLFADAGAVHLNSNPFSINDFSSGYGIGLTFLLLPYNSFRIEFALDEFHNTQWIFDLGVSF